MNILGAVDVATLHRYAAPLSVWIAAPPAHGLVVGNGSGAALSLAPGSARNVAISDGTDWASRQLQAADIPALTYVTSVGLSLPAIFTVSGSPVTGSGTLTATLAVENPNKVFAGPTSGADAAPTFRVLVTGDIPDLSLVYQPKDATLTALAGYNTNGLLTQTAADTFVGRSIAAGTGISLTNGDGVAGNPTVAIDSTVVTLTGSQTLTNKNIIATQLTGTLQAAQFPALTGDVTTVAGALAATLATVNANVGAFALATVTVNAKGLVTAASAAATTGSGNVVLATSPTIVTPTITDFTNATHSHQNAAGGGTLNASAIAAGALALARGGTAVDLSAAGGATMVLAQDASHVISARNLIAADIPPLTLSKISDAGTIASQNADNVNITGGAIDDVTFGFNNQVQGVQLFIDVSDGGTATFPQAIILQHDTSGTPANSFGVSVIFRGQTSGTGGTTGQSMATLIGSWNIADHPTRVGQLILRTFQQATPVNSLILTPTTLTIVSTAVLIAGTGSAAAPAVQFSNGGANAGMYASASNILAFSTSSTARLTIGTTIAPQVPIRVADGAVGTPSYSFSSNTGAGLYNIGSNDIGFSINGALVSEWTAGVFSAVGDLKISTVSKGLYVKEGTNATMGLATLSSGTVTVSTNKVTASSRIFLTHQTTSGTAGVLAVTARSAGVSFTITSTSGSDAGTVGWFIVEPA